MLTPIACMVCNVDPATTSMLLPLAQATIISAPILLRNQLRRAFRAVREHRRCHDSDPVAEASVEAVERDHEARSRG